MAKETQLEQPRYTKEEHLHHSFPTELGQLILDAKPYQRRNLYKSVHPVIIDTYTECDVLIEAGRVVARNSWIEPLPNTVVRIAQSLDLSSEKQEALLQKAAKERNVFHQQLVYDQQNVQSGEVKDSNAKFLKRLEEVYNRSHRNHPE